MSKKNGRVYIRIDPELKQQVQEFCDRKHTTISDVVNRFLARMIEEVEALAEKGCITPSQAKTALRALHAA